jgi:hypothetical protein
MYLSDYSKMVLSSPGHIKPDGISKDQFEKQSLDFDSEISNWRLALDANKKPPAITRFKIYKSIWPYME